MRFGPRDADLRFGLISDGDQVDRVRMQILPRDCLHVVGGNRGDDLGIPLGIVETESVEVGSPGTELEFAL